jgi:hypothetical protein
MNISGFGLQLWMKGMPYPTAVASGVVVAELIAPVALVLGLAPRVTASALIATTMITTGILHRFWDLAGAVRQAEQALFMAHAGLVAGLLFYAVAEPSPRHQPSQRLQPRRSRGASQQPPARLRVTRSSLRRHSRRASARRLCSPDPNTS